MTVSKEKAEKYEGGPQLSLLDSYRQPLTQKASEVSRNHAIYVFSDRTKIH